MTTTIDASEAGAGVEELTLRVVAEQAPVVVERDGKPQVVILTIEEYERLGGGGWESTGWRSALARTHDMIRREGAAPLDPPPEEVIRQGREERDARLLDHLR
jgi:prevent-host-death family protein